jgi:maleamate amidohydrolase
MMSVYDRWKSVVPEKDLASYAELGFGGRIGIGNKVALLNIDASNIYVDPKFKYTSSDTSSLIDHIAKVTSLFRSLKLPIYYVGRDDRSMPQYRGMWSVKQMKTTTKEYLAQGADEWPIAYAPRDMDCIVRKNKPSPFFGTPLESFLRYDGVDSLVIVGTATSGCIRAAVVDAFSHNFKVTVMKEGCGDRSDFAHHANLFDMDMKYADVESYEHIKEALGKKFSS